MEQSKIFTLFYHLSDLRNRNREDVVRLIIEKVDYETLVVRFTRWPIADND